MNQPKQYQYSRSVSTLSGILITLILVLLMTACSSNDAHAFSGGHWCKKDQLNVSPCWPQPGPDPDPYTPPDEVHNVPVPGSVWLLGGGLIILGAAKRFRRG